MRNISFRGRSIGIEVVDLVWKGLRRVALFIGQVLAVLVLKSLTWFGRDCDMTIDVSLGVKLTPLKSLTWFGRDCDAPEAAARAWPPRIEVVDLVWKGLRQG